MSDETHRAVGYTTEFRAKIDQLRALTAERDARDLERTGFGVPTVTPDPQEPSTPPVSDALSKGTA